MDEHDFDQILQTDFHPNVHTADHHHLRLDDDRADDHADAAEGNDQQPQAAVEEAAIDPALHDSSPVEFPPESPPETLPPGVKGIQQPKSISSMSVEERKQRQRDQNRLAARRARKKKQGALGELEGGVEALQKENERLRARLDQLSANQPASVASPVDGPPTKSTDTAGKPNDKSRGIDHGYFRKVVKDIRQVKEALINREIELQRVRDGNDEPFEPSSDTVRLRGELTKKLAKFTMLKSEERAIETIIRNLNSEKDNLGRFRGRIQREVDKTIGPRANEVNVTLSSHDSADKTLDFPAGSYEKALLDARRCVDETLYNWEDGTDVDMGALLDPRLQDAASPST